ncbi:MAG: hypothetical protein QG608_2138 [Actinomycetota bacterium]|nr:hypothetical protein [Actinomycetota bacterium]
MTPDDDPAPALDRQDAELFAALRRLWEKKDPVPPDLADRILFAMALEDLEFELLSLETAAPVLSARGEEQVRTVTFSGESLSVLVSIDRDRNGRVRLDGWIGPENSGNEELDVELRCGQTVLYGRSDKDGRFAFDEVPAGLVQLVFRPPHREGHCPARAVVTPAVQV